MGEWLQPQITSRTEVVVWDIARSTDTVILNYGLLTLTQALVQIRRGPYTVTVQQRLTSLQPEVHTMLSVEEAIVDPLQKNGPCCSD